MSAAKEGDLVKVHYTGKLADGTIFDSSRDKKPLEFKIRGGEMIVGFDKAVAGMSVGDKKSVTISSKDAYGDYNEALIHEIERTQLPPDLEPKVGLQLEGTKDDGKRVLFTVIKISEDNITLDANHPLAGKELIFDLELMEIN
jgi:FKBP-type peptidyl-prolyl cis-trans isomerase 2